MKNYMSNKEIQKYSDEIQKHKYKCSCGHVTFIDNKKDKTICTWCNNYVFKSKEDEFKYRINERLRNDKWKRNGKI